MVGTSIVLHPSHAAKNSASPTPTPLLSSFFIIVVFGYTKDPIFSKVFGYTKAKSNFPIREWHPFPSYTKGTLRTPRRNNNFGTKSSSVVSSVRFDRVSVCTCTGNGECCTHH